jgi:hypothetical protein
MLAGLALALRFFPYSHHGKINAGWSAALIAYGLLVVAASVYLVYVLEIVKFRGRALWQSSRRPGANPASNGAGGEGTAGSAEPQASTRVGASRRA